MSLPTSLVLLTALVGVAPSSAAAAAEPSPIHVSAVSIVATPVISGLDVGQLTVQLRMQSSTGVPVEAATPTNVGAWNAPDAPTPTSCPCAFVVNTAPNRGVESAGFARVPLTLVSGDRTDGTWRATLPLTSAQGGSWVVDDILVAAPTDWVADLAHPAVVRGLDWPVITFAPRGRLPVAPGATLAFAGTVRLAATHAPAAGVRLAVWSSSLSGGEASRPVRFVRTGAGGTFGFAVVADGPGSYVVGVARQVGPRSAQRLEHRGHWILPSVSVRPSARTLRRGAVLTVAVAVGGPAQATVRLERQVARHWVVVTTERTTRRRAVLSTRPTGTRTYRVVVTGASVYREAASPVFTVTLH